MARLIRRIRLLLGREAAERAMDDEMRHHLECEIAEHVSGGMAPEAARRRALVDFGGVQRFKEAGRDARGVRAVEDFVADVAYALRVLQRNPGFTLASVLTFALGIGAGAAVFSVVHGVLFRPLPYRTPDQLVVLWERNMAKGQDRNVVAMANFEAWQQQARSFEGMAALVPAPATVLSAGGAERVTGVQVSPGYFHLLGIAPAIGREFTSAEASGANVAVISDAFWRRHFDADPNTPGRTFVLDGRPVTVAGVMPADFEPPRFGWIDAQDFWLPYGPLAGFRQWGRAFHVVARLRQGVSPAVAQAELASLSERLAADVPGDKGWSATVTGLSAQITGDVRTPLLLLLGGVGLLLLMAVTNVANLSVGFSRRRESEYAVRRAIGASSGRLLRQLFVQNALMAGIGCLLGLAVATIGLRGLMALMPSTMPRASEIHLDATVVLTAIAVTASASLVFGSVAAFRSGDGSVATLRAARSGPAASRWGGGALITLEIALAMMITILATLMIRSFTNLRAVPLGFDPSGVVAGRIGLSGNQYATPERAQSFFDDLVAKLRAAPGAQAVSIANVRPFRGGAPATEVTDPLHPPAGGIEPPTTDIRFVDSAFFATIRIPLVAGSGFGAHEASQGAPHVVVNRTLVRALGMGPNPIGRHVRIALNGGIDAEIVGVTGDARLTDVRTPARGTAYLAASRFPSTVYDVLVRGTIAPDRLTQLVRTTVASLDAAVPVYELEPLHVIVDRSTASDRFALVLLAIFSIVALSLAAVGVYGVFAADVARREREIGIRVALGARSRGLITGIVRRALARAAIGIVVGLVVAAFLTRAMASMLFGVGTTDTISYATVSAILLGVAALATVIPAWRATRVSPLTALRSE